MKNVYQLSDLTDRKTLDHGASKPARLAVIGYPVAHSASPAMHQAALDANAMDMRYIRLEVEPGQVAEAFSQMKKLEFIGCNVTVPHKLEAKECCDSLSDEAKALGVVNTITFNDSAQEIRGHNTDGPGLENAIQEEFAVKLSQLHVMILGVGGGAGKAIATQCCRAGSPQIWLVNRTKQKAIDLAANLRSYPSSSIKALSSDDDILAKAILQTDLIINATSLGMKSDDALPIPSELLNADQMVYDAIYKPAETRLLKQAKSRGAKTANGFSMLLHQGVIAYEHWFPGQSVVSDMRSGLTSTL